MNRIDEKFIELRKEKKKALIVFLTAGYPDLETTEKLVYHLENCGVDIIELGVPFSDPIADGVTIQYSSQVALNQGINLNKIFVLCGKIRKKSNLPLVLMSYYNPVYQFRNFFKNAKKSGVDGIIIPDLLPEESEDILPLTSALGLSLIYLLAPTSNGERIRIITQKSQSFIYVVSLTGVTGVRKKLPEGLKTFLTKVRRYTNKPLALGFGISSPEQVYPVKNLIDGVIVGSAIIEIIRKKNNPFPYVRSFLGSLKKALT